MGDISRQTGGTDAWPRKVVSRHNRRWAMSTLATASLLSLTAITGCGQGSNVANTQASANTNGVVRAVAAEDQYASVISQIGGHFVSVKALMSNPNTDPHTYEASTADAALIGGAQLVIQNGLGYDGFMNKLEAASPNPKRKVIDVAQSLGYSPQTPNPHLWYNPATMARTAVLVEQDLAHEDPTHAAYFKQNLQRFEASIKSLDQAIAAVKRTEANTPVAVTEPVADYLLQAAGMDIKTPWTFQVAVMNGIDPAPQDVQTEDDLITQHKVKVLVYNLQAVNTATNALLSEARASHVPVVGVFETMPPADTYQSWMQSEVRDLSNAIQHGTSAGMVN
ncbi:metal ABC transporter solute-binding protein, Zn/Mn family [Alicyclobacillus sp. ALC3]|uniref:metal ABC transporter solute-binding protein, Zn/Mn family n=1 Tax=Alicyclobacillus sp. ALC3 TaxID=2796143 RepID=UPI0023795B17|nr:zinc ABC transporter substrate-binding protein [Alicyclobacillus sp. ALC3]WDL95861.1 zinc ABC transporter substrate-binding protein [Alicyclobacillus sp. ALC3]